MPRAASWGWKISFFKDVKTIKIILIEQKILKHTEHLDTRGRRNGETENGETGKRRTGNGERRNGERGTENGEREKGRNGEWKTNNE
jgi:hypothetical protein